MQEKQNSAQDAKYNINKHKNPEEDGQAPNTIIIEVKFACEDGSGNNEGTQVEDRATDHEKKPSVVG